MIELKACEQDHVLFHPEALHDVAIQLNQELAFCQACECGTVFLVVIWPGDRARIMMSGDTDLFERLEATEWPERVWEDPQGQIFYRVVPDFGLMEAGFV